MSDTAVADAPATTTLVTETATTPEGATTPAPDATAPASADAPSLTTAPAETPAPIVYEFTAPEGVTFDAALLEQVTPLLADANVPPEKAQALVNAYAKHVAALDTARHEQHAAQVQSWADEVKADAEIGGAKLPATIAHAQRAIHRFGGEALKAVLNETGLGNHPALVRAFAAAGAAVAEDSAIRSANGASSAPRKTLEQSLYPTMHKE